MSMWREVLYTNETDALNVRDQLAVRAVDSSNGLFDAPNDH